MSRCTDMLKIIGVVAITPRKLCTLDATVALIPVQESYRQSRIHDTAGVWT